MVYSMTGYGKGNLVLNGRDITVEVKSVNHRYFEYTGRMSRAYSFLDDKIKKEVQSMISRGKVEVSLMINYTQKSDTRITADIPLAKSYYEALQSIAYSLDIPLNASVKELSKFDGVLTRTRTEEMPTPFGTMLISFCTRLWKAFWKCERQRVKS